MNSWTENYFTNQDGNESTRTVRIGDVYRFIDHATRITFQITDIGKAIWLDEDCKFTSISEQQVKFYLTEFFDNEMVKYKASHHNASIICPSCKKFCFQTCEDL